MTQQLICEHRPDWIRERDNGDRYCAVCRIVFFDSGDDIEATEVKGGADEYEHDGR